MLRLLAVLFVVLGVACSQSHTGPDAAADAEASFDDASTDAAGPPPHRPTYFATPDLDEPYMQSGLIGVRAAMATSAAPSLCERDLNESPEDAGAYFIAFALMRDPASREVAGTYEWPAAGSRQAAAIRYRYGGSGAIGGSTGVSLTASRVIVGPPSESGIAMTGYFRFSDGMVIDFDEVVPGCFPTGI